MQLKLLEILACPQCRGDLSCVSRESGEDGGVREGELGCAPCRKVYPVEDGIPRFVPRENYASSFGYQWNRFKLEQIDSANGTNLSEKRFYSETGWSAEGLGGKWVLDAGCGAGRFLDVASRSGAEVVGLDISDAVDAARANLAGRGNAHLVQGSILSPPFKAGAFDACYCIGVIQHTPDPRAALRALPVLLREGGRIAVTIYERKPWTKLNAKYLVRPLTKRLGKERLLRGIRGAMPVLFPLTDVLFRLPVVGRVFVFSIPVANYVGEKSLSRRQRYDWAVLDTFDMLSPQYDQPQTQDEVQAALAEAGVVDIERLPNPGVNVVGRKEGGRPAAAGVRPGVPAAAPALSGATSPAERGSN
ncbi:MAG TPA: methyltransferase domain-containing protein [Pyrinomonadaceae bacterium]|nr:methyltransferase domain-containing protein [Pyrinomonadaceae bacterium]